MIPRQTLKTLVSKRILDSRTLLNGRRYFACVYMAGYAIELALKYRISILMQFSNGFPENKTELNNYYSDAGNTLLRNTISEIREIRNHKLTLLLRFSGEKVNIENH